jgi:hypothetical protein
MTNSQSPIGAFEAIGEIARDFKSLAARRSPMGKNDPIP